MKWATILQIILISIFNFAGLITFWSMHSPTFISCVKSSNLWENILTHLILLKLTTVVTELLLLKWHLKKVIKTLSPYFDTLIQKYIFKNDSNYRTLLVITFSLSKIKLSTRNIDRIFLSDLHATLVFSSRHKCRFFFFVFDTSKTKI